MDRRRLAKLLVGSPTRLDVVWWFESNQHGLHFSAGAITQGISAQRTAVGEALEDLVESGLLVAKKGPRGWPEYRRLESPLWALLAALSPAIEAAASHDGAPRHGARASLVPMPLLEDSVVRRVPPASH